MAESTWIDKPITGVKIKPGLQRSKCVYISMQRTYILCIKNPNVAYTEKACLRGIWNKLWNFFTSVFEDINNSMFDRKFCMDPPIQLPPLYRLQSTPNMYPIFLVCSTLALLNIHCRQCTGTVDGDVACYVVFQHFLLILRIQSEA